ncbi:MULTISPECIES: glutamate racemase [unclassified Xanthobacter]|uniref:glutamate racemase n=1 Tax=unclassified Xanthobacter TaxID=2623496 RepID=UPI001EDFEA81|nr:MULTISPECIES: glutamate racemase [unclassified Xanthobacter]
MTIVTACAERVAAVSPVSHPAPTILVFDSGVGGLSVFREVARARPDASFVYAADDAGFPYGGLSDAALVARVDGVVDRLIALTRPQLVVIACNTASTVVLPSLRARHALPFVGTVPAVKPACAGSRSGRVSILATPGTVRRDYTAGLIREFAAHCEVTLVPSVHLAEIAEAELAGRPVPDAVIQAEIAPCFVAEDGRRTDTVVLACTHYPLLLHRLRRLAPWPVDWVDPAPAIARRVVQLLGPADAGEGPAAPVRLISTARPLDAAQVSRVAARQVRPPEILAPPLAVAS